MEPKVIIYIILGIFYLIYSANKKMQEKGKQVAPEDNDSPPVAKPVSPPSANPLEDVMREIKRRQAEMEAQKRKASTPQTQFTQAVKPKKQYKEPEIPDEMKIKRTPVRLANEGTYKVETMEEARAKSDEDNAFTYEFDARQAFIGSVIMERKF